MKKAIITILLASATIIGYSQKKSVPDSTAKSDSVTMDTPILSINDMEKLNLVIMKQFDLTESGKYQAILKEIQSLIAEGQKRAKPAKK